MTEEINEPEITEQPTDNLEHYKSECERLQSSLNAALLQRDVSAYVDELQTEFGADNYIFDRSKLNSILAHVPLTEENYREVVRSMAASLKQPNTIITPELQIPNELYERKKEPPQDFEKLRSDLWKKF